MPKRVIGSTLKLDLGEGTPDPMVEGALSKELDNLKKFFLNGGPVGQSGPITEVKGVRLVISYALSVDAPEETWNKLQAATVPADAEVGRPNAPTRLPGKYRQHRRHT